MMEKCIKNFCNKHLEILNLPIIVNNGNEVFQTLNQRWDKYLSLVKNTDFLKHCVPAIENYIDTLKKCVKSYYSANFDEANRLIRNIISDMIQQPHFFTNDLTSLYCDGESHQWYRARISNEILEKNDLRHIPFSHRAQIANYRYSINGIPCLYLGNSIFTCWNELDNPKIENFWVGRFFPMKTLSVLNLGTTLFEVVNAGHYIKTYIDNKIKFEQLITFFFQNWILQSACSVTVKEKNRIFKEEYIIPQLVMQNLKSFNIDGIIYFSTKIKSAYSNQIGWISKNLAIPAFDNDYGDYSQKIDSSFAFSKPINVGFFQNGITPPRTKAYDENTNSARKNALMCIGGNIPYCYSIFYKSEIELIQYYYELGKHIAQFKNKE